MTRDLTPQTRRDFKRAELKRWREGDCAGLIAQAEAEVRASLALNADRLGYAMDLVDEEDMRVGIVGRGRKVDRIIDAYRALIEGSDPASPEPGDTSAAATELYVVGHRHGVKCGVESAGLGTAECEHVGSWVLTRTGPFDADAEVSPVAATEPRSESPVTGEGP